MSGWSRGHLGGYGDSDRRREGISRTTTLISTHTLVGDTLVGGRMLVHIAVASKVTVESVIEEAGMEGTGM